MIPPSGMRNFRVAILGAAVIGLAACSTTGDHAAAQIRPATKASPDMARATVAVVYSESALALFNRARSMGAKSPWIEIGMLPIEFRRRLTRNFKSVTSIEKITDPSDADLIAVWDVSSVIDKQRLNVENSLSFYTRDNRKIAVLHGENARALPIFKVSENAHKAVAGALDALEYAMRESTALAEEARRAVSEASSASTHIAGQAAQTDLQAMVEAAARKALSGRARLEAIAAKPAIESDIDKPGYQSPENPNNFALVVGIEKYSGVLEALYAERDALAVRDHLLALGYPQRNIILLTGDKATRSGLTKILETWLPRNISADSTVFFYYSGHGAPDVKNGDAYLVPWDGDPQFLRETAYPVKRLYSKLGSLKAKRVLVAMDSCFSGAGGRSVLTKGSRPLVSKAAGYDAVAANIVAFSAAGSDQISGTMDDQGHGAFTYYLLKGLGGEAGDSSGHVTVKSLYDYLSPKVADAARRQNRDQTPQLIQAAGESGSMRLR